MTISNEAIELAAMAIMCVGEEVWELQTPRIKEAARSDARAALEAAAPIIRERALEDAAEAIDWIRPEMGPGINITQYREGRNDALTSAASWLRARAVAERGGA